MKYRKWGLKEKLDILKEAEDIGAIESCRKNGVSTGTYYSWKKKFDSQCELGLKVTHQDKTKEHKAADEENRLLRKLLIDKDIELEVQ